MGLKLTNVKTMSAVGRGGNQAWAIMEHMGYFGGGGLGPRGEGHLHLVEAHPRPAKAGLGFP